jgi:hypothetical protein
VVDLLELFEGRISATEILEMEIPFLNDLIFAKEKRIKEREQLRLKELNK